MRKPKIDADYFTVCVYVFIVVSVTTLGIIIGVNLSDIFKSIGSFFSAIKCVIYGLCIAYFINYIMGFAENKLFAMIKHKFIRRLFSIITSYFFFCLIIAVFLLLIIPEIASNYSVLLEKITGIIQWIISFVDSMFGDSTNIINESVIAETITGFLYGLLDVGGTIFKEIGNIFIGLVLSFYILLRKENLARGATKILKVVLPMKVFDTFFKFLDMLNATFGKYFMGTIVASFFVGLETLICMLITGIPYAYLVCAIVAFTNVIPYFGPFLGAIPSSIIIFSADPIKALWFIVIILLIQQIDGNFITPRIIGNSVGLSSIWIIISITIFSALFGVLGMLIGVPLFTVIYNLVRDWVNLRLNKKGYSTDPSKYEKLFSSSSSAYTKIDQNITDDTISDDTEQISTIKE